MLIYLSDQDFFFLIKIQWSPLIKSMPNNPAQKKKKEKKPNNQDIK